VTLYYTSRVISFMDLGDIFGIPPTTCWRYVRWFKKLFVACLIPNLVKRPSLDELQEKATKNQILNGAVLAVDGTHLPIHAPFAFPDRYINRKGWHSINVQLTVDFDCIVRDIAGGCPGSCHDAYVFNRSSLKSWGASEAFHLVSL
jgi:hypothetical protein